LVIAAAAFDASAAIWYVDASNPGTEDGTSWATAYRTIQPAIDASLPGDEIWVADGVYSEVRSGNPTGSVALKNAVALYGGFAGNETARAQRNWKTNVTIIDGINGRGASIRAYHVVVGANNAVLDGFTVRNGKANGITLNLQSGGGMDNTNVSPTVRNCIFYDNEADKTAGAILNNNSSAIIDACTFYSNRALGISGDGGGGAICNDNGGTATITNCVFYNNQVSGTVPASGGGAIINSAHSPIITNCTFAFNISPPPSSGEGGGGAILNTNNSTATVRNCIMWGDTSPEIANSTLFVGAANVTFSNVQGGYTGTGNINADPLFVLPGNPNHNYRLLAGSPCINTGTNTGAPARDRDGTNRPLDGTVDMGAYEYDVTPPTVSCLNNLKFLNNNGVASITAIELDNGSSDAGGIASRSINLTQLDCSHIPSTIVTLTVTDWAGNSASCNATVTVQDVIEPIIDNCSGNVFVPVNSSCQAVVPDMATPTIASDNCFIASKTQSPVAGTLISVPTQVTITVTDPAGLTATCSAFAIPQDSVAPTFNTCPANRVLNLNASCQATVPNMVPEASATDNCAGPVTITQSPVAGSTISATTLVTFTATDGAGNAGTCTAILTANDNVDPVFTVCPPTQQVNLDNACAATVPDVVALAVVTDNCTVQSVVQAPVAGTPISVDTNVVITATDNSGNTQTCNVLIDVVDVTDPQIVVCAVDDTVTLQPGCQASLPDLTGGVVATDNCGTPVVTQSPVAGTIISADTIVTLTATDGAGNTDTCTATVFIDDATPPTINSCAPATSVPVNASCSATMPDLTTQVQASDECGIASITQAPLAGSSFSIPTLVTFTVTDNGGNTSTCNVLVTPIDTTEPTITTCATNQNVVLNSNCEGLVPDMTVGVVATDNCPGSVTITQSPIAGTVISTTTTVTITATDVAGNASTCTADVIASDNAAPVIDVCPATVNVNLNASCEIAIPDLTVQVQTTDNCPVTITQNPIAGTLINSDTVVTITATDSGNLSSTCNITVDVTDVTGPVITRTGPATVVVPVNGSYVEQGATAVDACDGSVAVNIAGGPVVTTAPNTYVLTYTAQDTSGNPGTPVTRTVTVTNDTTPPVITLIGANLITVNCGAGYTELGATALDNLDGNITANIVIGGDVVTPTSPPGDYTVTYTVQDSAGNVGNRTRIVRVLNNCSLTVSVVGPLFRQADEGDSVTLEVAVTGAVGPASIQWERQVGNAWQPIVGEESLTYTIPFVNPSDFGNYRATASDSISTAVSQVINLVLTGSLPAAGLVGLIGMSIATALAGVVGLRRRK